MSYGAGEHRREAVPDGGLARVYRRIADLEAQVARLEAACWPAAMAGDGGHARRIRDRAGHDGAAGRLAR